MAYPIPKAGADPEENSTEQTGETAADESGEDSGKSVLVPSDMFPDAKENDIVKMRVGKSFGKELELMATSEKAAAEKPEMPMSPSIEDDMRAEMMKG